MSVLSKTRPVLLAGLFIAGALQQFLFWRLYVYLAYGPDPGVARSFVDGPLTNVGLCLVGGVATCVFGAMLVRKSQAEVHPKAFFDQMLRAGLYGLGASFSAVQGFYILASIYLAFQGLDSIHASLLMLPGAVVLWLIEFQFDGAFAAAPCVVTSFFVWFVAAGVIKGCSSRCPLLRVIRNHGV